MPSDLQIELTCLEQVGIYTQQLLCRIIKEDVGAVLEKLIEIHHKKEARDKTVDDDIVRTLLFSLTIVEYETEEGRWCDINLILLPLLEKWREQSSKVDTP